jgi:hypothetical protein
MKRYYLANDYSKEATDIARKHLKMIGKDATSKEAVDLLDVIVRNNPNFPAYDEIEEIVDAFFKAIHYGSHELKNASLLAHSRSFTDWIKNRTSINPISQQANSSEKPNTWKYNPDEPLPSDIDSAKARNLLITLANWRGSDINEWRTKHFELIPVGTADGWMHYINKLKARAKGTA